MTKKIRVLIAKPGLDGHERGAKVIAYALRDAGFEVIYSGLRQTPDQIVNAAIQESVDIVGLSILSGAHISLTRRVIEKLRDRGSEEIGVLVGGVIREEDIPVLKGLGVLEVFTSGTSFDRMTRFIEEHAGEKGQG